MPPTPKTILQTQRLLLQEANLNDAPFFYKLLNSPNWIEFIGDRGIKTLADAEAYIRNSLIKSYRENGFGLYKMLLKKEGAPIGLCGLVNRPTLPLPDIGFAILPAYEQKGYTREAANAILAYSHKILGLETILAITSEGNSNSKKLLEKIGMKRIVLDVPNAEKDLLVYSTGI